MREGKGVQRATRFQAVFRRWIQHTHFWSMISLAEMALKTSCKSPEGDHKFSFNFSGLGERAAGADIDKLADHEQHQAQNKRAASSEKHEVARARDNRSGEHRQAGGNQQYHTEVCSPLRLGLKL